MKLVTPTALLPGVRLHGKNEANGKRHIRVNRNFKVATEIIFQPLTARDLVSIRKEKPNQSVVTNRAD